jgi:ribosomal protein S18 acetylase RimI-like enzyme
MNLDFRHTLRPEDPMIIRDLTRSSGFFSPEEIELAVELAAETLGSGPASGYNFLFVREGTKVLGYTCFGPIPCTRQRFDLYWIAVLDSARGRGLGRALMARTEDAARSMNAVRMYAETASRPQYEPTRAFYRSCGYVVEAVLPGFYDDTDDKIIFRKNL